MTGADQARIQKVEISGADWEQARRKVVKKKAGNVDGEVFFLLTPPLMGDSHIKGLALFNFSWKTFDGNKVIVGKEIMKYLFRQEKRKR